MGRSPLIGFASSPKDRAMWKSTTASAATDIATGRKAIGFLITSGIVIRH